MKRTKILSYRIEKIIKSEKEINDKFLDKLADFVASKRMKDFLVSQRTELVETEDKRCKHCGSIVWNLFPLKLKKKYNGRHIQNKDKKKVQSAVKRRKPKVS